MKRRIELSRMGLKGIVCISMLLDHIGAVLPPWPIFRILGRLAFPIVCYFLAEGAVYTKSPVRYSLRLLTAALVSEIPFDLCFYGEISFEKQNTLFTLLIALAMLRAVINSASWWQSIGAMILGASLAEFLHADYGAYGIILVLTFYLTRTHPHKMILQWGIILCMGYIRPGTLLCFRGIGIPIQLFSVLSLPLIHGCREPKEKRNFAGKYVFYLFYPIHLLTLWGIRCILYVASSTG